MVYNKKYLSHYNLDVELFKEFDLEVYDVVPIRSVYIIYTDKGRKILKKVEYTIKELNFINDGIKYIKNKFSRVVDFLNNKNGEIYSIWNKDMYCIMDLVEGRESDFNNPIDICISAEGIGELHKASEGFKTDLCNKYYNGKLIDKLNRKIDEMNFFKNIANMHENKTEFDNIFLKEVNYHIDEIKTSINILENSLYYKLCSEEDKVVLCHHDLAHHNILINDNKAYFIDFDYSIIDLKVHDLCNFINKVVKDFAFDIEKAKIIINSYCKKNSLDEREIKVLYGMLNFPEDFYNISKDYYTKRKDWEEEEFLNKLKKKSSYRNYRKEFLFLFKEYGNIK
ncbi:spore coat protein I [Clostridium acetireducens DSM 10703]|jgi:CotS family spore coat protein|uniref:Spore coat protein I n=1 Tax=Clostridium acetireducens DSM 10703 TaxID=1121290 RepID=A0A1E8EYX5_9CLOT|nr:CotS family spore coat protein [Clostridium acetireducens]OFI06171.1 spore coat protein I [Clostridium acetireducens DSM 10703]